MNPSKSAVPAELALIDTTAPPRDRPAKAVKPDEGRPPFTPMTIPKFLARKMAGNIAANLIWMAIVGFFPAKKALFALCAFVASRGGWVVAEAGAENKPPGLVARIGESLKHPIQSAAKPIEAVKEGTKKTVAKAEEKAEALKEEVAEQAEDVKQTPKGLNLAALPPIPVPAPQPAPQPGLLDRAKGTLVSARDALVDRLDDAFAGEELTPEQAQARRDRMVRERQVNARRVGKMRNATMLGQMGAAQMADAATLAGQSQMQFQQAAGNGLQQHNAMTQQLNAALRGR